MATSTDVPIYTTTLASNVQNLTIDVSDFQQYTNLKIVANVAMSGTDGYRIRLGNTSLDTGSNYSYTYLYGTGSTKGSFKGSNDTYGSIGDGTTQLGVHTWVIYNYSNTNTYKAILGRSGTSNRDTQLHINTWRSNDPVKLIYIDTTGTHLAAGATFSVYGVGTASLPVKATGGAIYSDSNYWYHVFTSTGAFTPTQSLTVDILTVAGGGGSGYAYGAGGGAGGLLYSPSQSLSSGVAYTCSVGAGGNNGTNGSRVGVQGTNSTITGSGFTTLTAIGGGGGGANSSGNQPPTSGGSGGGASGDGSYNGAGGTATSGQGYAGGAVTSGNTGGSGGGGAGGAGTPVVGNQTGAHGGVGSSTYNTWSLATGVGQNVSGTYYIAGGGAGSGGTGGYGGGASAGGSGKINTGGGGGGDAGSGAGGSGVVIVRYAK